MAEIHLTNSELKTIVDDSLYDQLIVYKLRSNHNGYCEYDRKTSLYKKFKTRKLHRIIYQLINGPITKKEQVDHIDRNPLNNTISNLRLVTNAQNSRNTKRRPGSGTSWFKGVHWDKYRGKWIAKIQVDGKNKYLGAYDDQKIAAAKYNEAVIEYFGDYGLLNDLDNPKKDWELYNEEN